MWDVSLFWIIINSCFVFFYMSHRSVGKVFCTMDGHGSMVHIHPSSSVSVFLKLSEKISVAYLLHSWFIFFNLYLLMLPAVWPGGRAGLDHFPWCAGDLAGVCPDGVSYSIWMGEGPITKTPWGGCLWTEQCGKRRSDGWGDDKMGDKGGGQKTARFSELFIKYSFGNRDLVRCCVLSMCEILLMP